MPQQKTTYHAVYQLDPSGNWLARLQEIPQVQTFGKTYGKARENLLTALTLWLGRQVDVHGSIELHDTVSLPEGVKEALDLAVGAREMAEAIAKESNDLMAAAAISLVEDGHLSVRDAAVFLGISHQRVQQIVSAVRAEQRADELRKAAAFRREQVVQQQENNPQLSTAEALIVALLVGAGAALIISATGK